MGIFWGFCLWSEVNEFAVTFLLFQVKTGKQKAQEQLVFSHCVFTGPLPMVSCGEVEHNNLKGIARKTDTDVVENVNKIIIGKKMILMW